MFKKNTAVTGFVIGKFILTADGAEATTGTPVCKRTIDGTGGTLTNSASFDATSGLWKINLAAGDMDGDLIGLAFTLADCQPITYTIKTVTGVPDESGYMPVDIQTIAGNPVRDDSHGGLLPAFFDWLAIRSGSTRTVINVNGSNQYKTWAENALKGFMAYYMDPSEGDGTQVPCVILSNTEILVPGGGGGSITLAGDGLPQAPTGGSIRLLLHSHADIVDVLTKTNNLPNSVWQANTRSLTTFGSLANDVAAAVWAATSRTLSGFGSCSGYLDVCDSHDHRGNYYNLFRQHPANRRCVCAYRRSVECFRIGRCCRGKGPNRQDPRCARRRGIGHDSPIGRTRGYRRRFVGSCQYYRRKNAPAGVADYRRRVGRKSIRRGHWN